MRRARVILGGRLAAVCKVAQTASEQARGLQGHRPLGPGEGMLFPFRPARATTFHMGSVTFPIDIIFADAGGTIQKVIAGARPGARERWSAPVVGSVIELAAGECRRAGINVGDRVAVLTHNLGRMLTEADGPPLDGGYYTKEGPGVDQLPVRDPTEEWKDRMLPPDAFDWTTDGMGLGQWDESAGYAVPPKGLSEEPGQETRHGAKIINPGQVAATLFEGMARLSKGGAGAVLPWKPAPLAKFEGAETALVTLKDVAYWLSAVNEMSHEARQAMVEALDGDGLETLSQIMILGGMCTHAIPDESGEFISLTRKRKEATYGPLR